MSLSSFIVSLSYYGPWPCCISIFELVPMYSYRYRYRTTGHAHKPTIMTTTEAWPVIGADRRITMMTTKAWPVTIEPVTIERQQRHGPYLRVGFCGDWRWRLGCRMITMTTMMTPTEAWPVNNRNDDINKGMARSNQERHGPYSDLGRIGG